MDYPLCKASGTMSAAANTLNDVSLLVAALPGVTVLERHIDGHNAVLKITALGVIPAHRVQRICKAANVELEPPLQLKDLRVGLDTPRHLSLTASIEEFDAVHFGNLQMLGIHLVQHLQSAGAMAAEAANGLLKRWGGSRAGT